MFNSIIGNTLTPISFAICLGVALALGIDVGSHGHHVGQW